MFYLPLTALFPIIVSLSLMLGFLLPVQGDIHSGRDRPTVHASSLEALEAIFDQHDYQWPPQTGVPSIIIDAFPVGLDAIDIKRKKSLFFRVLLPIVLSENEIIRQQRQVLLTAFSNEKLRPDNNAWKALKEITVYYRVEDDLNDSQIREQLLKRVDELPVALALAQAANESGWGTSRFTREANNLFGEWTYRAGEGLAPLERDDGAIHSVRIFPDLRSSVKSYLHNINIGHGYDELRRLRATMRETHEPLDAEVLSTGLIRYSERGQAYVDEIRQMIRINRLQSLAGLRLAN